MKQPTRIFFLAVFGAAILLLPGRAAAQSGTVTDDAFLSNNSTTQKLNLNGQGISLIVAGSSAAVGSVSVGATTTYIKFQLQSSLPPNVAAANVQKATLKLFLSPSSAPGGAIDIYAVTGAWTESTLNSSSLPTLSPTPIASAIPVGTDMTFLVVDATQLVQEWLNGTANGGIANDGIALVAHTSSTYVVFDSKESAVTSHEPRLEIVLANTGPQGPQGSQGPTGQTGPQGAAATIKVEPAMVVPAGTPPAVMNSGTLNAADLTFILPQGAQGLQGPPGPPLPDLVYTDKDNTLTSNQTLQGDLTLAPTGSASSAQGYASNPLDLAASVSDQTNAPHNETFRWQSVPVNNGTQNFGAQLSLLYGGGVTPTPTGFFWNPTGIVNWAPGQTFPGAALGTDLTSEVTRATGAESSLTTNLNNEITRAQGAEATLSTNLTTETARATTAESSLATSLNNEIGRATASESSLATNLNNEIARAAQTTASNTFTGNQTINGNLILTGSGSLQFADGTIQSTASGVAAPQGFGSIIEGSSPVAPVGYIPLGQINGGDFWVTMAPMPTARSGLAAATDKQGNIYAIGGRDNNGVILNTVEVYNPATNTWCSSDTTLNQCPTSPTPMPTARRLLAAAVDANGNIYAIGGTPDLGATFLNTVEVYNPATNTWCSSDTTLNQCPTSPTPMPTARLALAAAVDANGNIYAIGGQTDVDVSCPFGQKCIVTVKANVSLNTVEVYNPATNTWCSSDTTLNQCPTSPTPMPTARLNLAAAVDKQGNIYAIGGTNANSTPLNTVEVYNPGTNSWPKGIAPPKCANLCPPPALPPMPTALLGLAAATDAQGNIYAIGGDTTGSPVGVSTVEVYNPGTHSWSTAASMLTARDTLAAAVDAQGNIYAIGGIFNNSQRLNTVERYTPPVTIYTFIKN